MWSRTLAGGLGVVAGQECGADGIAAGARQLEAAHGPQERVGHLEQDAGAVAGVGLGAGRAAVVEVAQRGECGLDDPVRRDPGQGGDERDATRVVLVLSVVQPLGRRDSSHGGLPSSCIDGRHRWG